MTSKILNFKILFFCMFVWMARQLTIYATLINKSSVTFTGGQKYLKHGYFTTPYPSKLQKGLTREYGFQNSSPPVYGVEGVIVFDYDTKNLVIYFNNPYTGTNYYGAWIMDNKDTAENRFNQVKPLANAEGKQMVKTYSTLVIKSIGTTGNDSEMKVEIFDIPVPSCGEPVERLNRPESCGSQGRCWMWCNNSTTKAANSTESVGKWCYSSDPTSCSSYTECSGYNSCVASSACNTNC